jgi:transcriptional regulator with XRE-family HTH domain
VTMSDVAKRAGVSTATVSRVLNNPAIVSVQTKARVLTAIASLDYSPNIFAASLGRSRGKNGSRSETAKESSSGKSKGPNAFGLATIARLRALKEENIKLKRIIREFNKHS